MAKKKVTRKTITKPKVKEINKSVKEKSTVKTNKVSVKDKISRVLLFVSLVLIVVAFLSTFAPAYNIQWHLDSGTVVAGTLTSLFTCLLRIRDGAIYTYDDGVESLKFLGRGLRKGVFNYVAVFLMILLVLIAIAVFVLVLTKKYKGKVKLIMSIVICISLIASVAIVLLSKKLFEVSGAISLEEHPIVFEEITISSLSIAPILYIFVGALALVTNATSFILDRK